MKKNPRRTFAKPSPIFHCEFLTLAVRRSSKRITCSYQGSSHCAQSRTLALLSHEDKRRPLMTSLMKRIFDMFYPSTTWLNKALYLMMNL